MDNNNKDKKEMSDFTGSLIGLGGIGAILAISLGTIPLSLTIGAGAFMLGGVVALNLKSSKK